MHAYSINKFIVANLILKKFIAKQLAISVYCPPLFYSIQHTLSIRVYVNYNCALIMYSVGIHIIYRIAMVQNMSMHVIKQKY